MCCRCTSIYLTYLNLSFFILFWLIFLLSNYLTFFMYTFSRVTKVGVICGIVLMVEEVVSFLWYTTMGNVGCIIVNWGGGEGVICFYTTSPTDTLSAFSISSILSSIGFSQSLAWVVDSTSIFFKSSFVRGLMFWVAISKTSYIFTMSSSFFTSCEGQPLNRL